MRVVGSQTALLDIAGADVFVGPVLPNAHLNPLGRW